jgi:hypothetical protein
MTTPEYRLKNRTAQAARVADRKERKVCIRCEDVLSKNSSCFCEKHLKKHRDYVQIEKQILQVKKNQHKRRKKGLCWDCSEPAELGKTRCKYHLMKARLKQKIRNLRNKKES